jgi:hypothetical protein
MATEDEGDEEANSSSGDIDRVVMGPGDRQDRAGGDKQDGDKQDGDRQDGGSEAGSRKEIVGRGTTRR